MPYLNRLNEILNSRLIENGNILKRQSGCDDITLEGNFILFKSDDVPVLHNQVLGGLFNDVAGYKEKNDWVVFSESKVLICEMKTKTRDGFEMQLKNGKALVDYILNKLRLNEINHKPKQNIRFRYILFSDRPSKLSGGKPKGTFNKDLNGLLFELTCGSQYLLNDFN